jgi:demethylmenaquinone methyltransferase/2-methoxy-6-polyprenyl-1,4-benzoquinol methylase
MGQAVIKTEKSENSSLIGPPLSKEQAVQRMFSSIARRYDLNNSLLSLGLHHRWKRDAVAGAGLGNGDRALDLCTGTADLALLMAKRVGPTGHVIGLDFNEAMLEIGKQKVREAGFSDRVTLTLDNALSLPFQDRSFDAVTVAFGVRNVADLGLAFREMFRVLKTGGRIVCLEFSRPTSPVLERLYRLYSFWFLPYLGKIVSGDRTGVYRYLPASILEFPDQETLVRLIQESGFKDVRYQNLTGGIVAIHTGVKP